MNAVGDNNLTEQKQGALGSLLRDRGLSLRTKGMIVFAIMIAYATILTLYGLHQKELLLERFIALQELHESEGVLRQSSVAAFNDMANLFVLLDVTRNSDPHQVMAHVGDIRSRYREIITKYPSLEPHFTTLSESIDLAIKEPTAVSVLRIRRDVLGIRNTILDLANQAQAKQQALGEEYRELGNRAAVTLLLLAVLGVIVFGAIAGIFFTRLTGDLKRLQLRALEIVHGSRGEPIPVNRHDEMGELVASVNHMVAELGQREHELDIERQKFFHHEKMAAIGTLAAGIVHEIGNPIAAINGLVQDLRSNEAYFKDKNLESSLGLILDHTERMSSINRDVSEFSMMRSDAKELMDFNSIVETTCRLMKHDSRLRSADLKIDLDTNLPAIFGVGDQLIQVLMNLLVNAADALEECGKTVQQITVQTSADLDKVCFSVSDNGCGMSDDVISHAMEAFYTTKDPGKGTGLGLSLCYSIVADHNGSIGIESEVGVGSKVSVFLPVASDEEL